MKLLGSHTQTLTVTVRMAREKPSSTATYCSINSGIPLHSPCEKRGGYFNRQKLQKDKHFHQFYQQIIYSYYVVLKPGNQSFRFKLCVSEWE